MATKKTLKATNIGNGFVRLETESSTKKLPKGIKAQAPKVKVTVTDYQGKPVISLIEGEPSFINKPLTMGKRKAQWVVDNIEAIKAFVQSN